jgi:hypothetical protein
LRRSPPAALAPITITSSATFSAAENQTAVATLTASGGTGSYTWSKIGGADTAKFTLTGAVLTFTSARFRDADRRQHRQRLPRAGAGRDGVSTPATQNISVTVLCADGPERLLGVEGCLGAMTGPPTSPVQAAASLTIALLLLLHGPTGREIRINPRNITSLHSPVPGQRNKVLAEGVGCLINTSDAKFVSVVETCESVSRMIEAPKP